MMKNPRSEEEKIIEDIRNLFRLKKEVKGIEGIELRIRTWKRRRKLLWTNKSK